MVKQKAREICIPICSPPLGIPFARPENVQCVQGVDGGSIGGPWGIERTHLLDARLTAAVKVSESQKERWKNSVWGGKASVIWDLYDYSYFSERLN